MSKIIEINFSKRKTQDEQEPRFTIQVDPSGSEFANAAFNDAGGYWMVFIGCRSFEDIPKMREKALQQLKIQKAVNG